MAKEKQDQKKIAEGNILDCHFLKDLRHQSVSPWLEQQLYKMVFPFDAILARVVCACASLKGNEMSPLSSSFFCLEIQWAKTTKTSHVMTLRYSSVVTSFWVNLREKTR